ncbi:MAG: hypothetical protein JSV16_06065 [Candidatus Hydrogenedentota bacterium]|nr:MAG: hypothetical protein JSV16_06065 [Candidatus Hydrogenedentota bacterium]
MITRTGCMRRICVALAVAGLVFVCPQAVVATGSLAGAGEQAAYEEPAPLAEGSLCQDAEPCRSPSKGPCLTRGIGGLINGFFAFGCRVNYGLTNWILSDKCDSD